MACWPASWCTHRPWWSDKFRRVDGLTPVTDADLARDAKGWYDRRGRMHPGEFPWQLSTLARLDREFPLPAPPPMPGQVWVQVEGAGRAFDAGDSFVILAVLRKLPVAMTQGDDEPQISMVHTWPPPGAALVAGPTPWGRDVPWWPESLVPKEDGNG